MRMKTKRIANSNADEILGGSLNDDSDENPSASASNLIIHPLTGRTTSPVSSQIAYIQ
jgi:hypothetical protein